MARCIATPATVATLLAFAALSVPAGARQGEPGGDHIICFKYSTFRMLAGESITGGSGDMEDMSLTISGPSGDYVISEGEVWAAPEGEKSLIASRAKTSVYLIHGDELKYAVFGPLAGERNKLVIWLSGSAFDGSSRDVGILSRFRIEDPDAEDCDKSFTYSWPNRWTLRLDQQEDANEATADPEATE